NAVFVEKVLPVVKPFACAKFRHLPAFAKDEAIANALGLAFEHFLSARAAGRDASQFPVALARFACLRIRSGRGYGKQNSTDAMEYRSQRKHGYDREPLHEDYAAPGADVADEVGARLDFQDWLETLRPARKRVAEHLVAGLTP